MQPIFVSSPPTKSLGYNTLMVSKLRLTIFLLALPLESLGYTTLMGAPPKEEPMSQWLGYVTRTGAPP